MSPTEIDALLFAGLTADQKAAVKFGKRRLLVVAGAGSGKTEVMAHHVAPHAISWVFAA
jgi:DNA helicase II / ATP-dependent DNA helicase PcrA